MRLGMVVRDDNGGLGNLTHDAWRRLRPDVTVIVQVRPCRGEPHPGRFEEAWTKTVTMPNPMTRRDWRKVADLADVWWSAETWYCPEAEATIREAGSRSVLYAMPELFAGSDADAIWNPTDYLMGAMPDRTRVVPMPCAPPDRWDPRTRVRRVLHLSGGAQYDRNGTGLLLEALRRVREPCEVLLHQPDTLHWSSARELRGLPSHVEVRVTRDYVTGMSSLYRWADLLLLPRRYAGLCLPAFEAFGHGLPVMMPNVEPQSGWPIVPVDAVRERPARMRGGKVPMWSVDPVVLARRLDGVLSADVTWVVRESERVRAWAEAHSWERLLPVWQDELSRLA
jgi:glycosyltransferase involved in cell wall biosynthesis